MRVLTVLAALFVTAASALAQTNENRMIRALSLQDCLAVALQHNFDVQIKRYDPQIDRFNLSGLYGAYDPVFSAAGQHDYNLSSGGVDQQGRPFAGTETDADSLSAGISGLLPWGLSYDLGGNLRDQTGSRPTTEVDPNNFTLSTNTIYGPGGVDTGTFLLNTNYGTVSRRSPFETTSGNVGVLTLQQPLLRNFWYDSTRLGISLQKLQLKISEADFRNQILTTVRAVELAYFNLISADENIRVQAKALELAQQLFNENKKRVEVGSMAPLDERQAEAEVATSRAALIQAQADRDDKERTLKDLLSDNYTNDWASVTIAPSEKLLAMPQQFDLQESWRKGLAQNPRYRVQPYQLADEQNAQRIRYRRNQLFPSLDLIGSVGYSGSGKEYSGALGQIQDRQNPNWSFGAQLSVPLSRTAERNSFKAAKATKEQSVLQLKQQQQRTLIQIETDIANAKSSLEQVQATREARSFREAALEAEQKKLENGKSTSYTVLQVQRDLTQARSDEISALAAYNIWLAELAYDEGTSLERRGINLEFK